MKNTIGAFNRLGVKAVMVAVWVGVVSLLTSSPTSAEAQLTNSAAIQIPTSPSEVLPPGAPAFDTNGMDFTNVTYKVAAGYEVASGLSGGSLGYLQLDADLWHPSFCDIGLGANTALGAFNDGIYSAGGDVEAIKNLSNFEIVGKAGVGYNFEGNVGAYGELGADLNYNLTRGTGGLLDWGPNVFTYCGVGVAIQALDFKVNSTASNLNKEVKVYIGIAF